MKLCWNQSNFQGSNNLKYKGYPGLLNYQFDSQSFSRLQLKLAYQNYEQQLLYKIQKQKSFLIRASIQVPNEVQPQKTPTISEAPQQQTDEIFKNRAFQQQQNQEDTPVPLSVQQGKREKYLDIKRRQYNNEDILLQPANIEKMGKIDTVAIHGGERRGRPRVRDSLTTPTCSTATYTFQNTEQLIAFQEGEYQSFEYGRYGNPTVKVAEEKIRLLEGGEDCLLSDSGMTTAVQLMQALVPVGGHIVTTHDCYRRTRQYIQTYLPALGITYSVIDPSDVDKLEEISNKKKIDLFFSETPTNPYLRCIDVARIAKICKKQNTILVVDSTFATPINSQPLKLGADLVIHSATKFLGGHNNILGGAVVGSMDLVDKIRKLHFIYGGIMDPQAATYLIWGIQTLDVRVQRQNQNALEIAKRLEAHPKVRKVYYPGLDSHPDSSIAKQQMRGYGGVITFEIDSDLHETARFIDGLKIPYIAPSLGGVQSLIEQPAIISYWDKTPEERASLGIKDNLVRFSVGLENIEDIWSDFEQSLNLLVLD